MSRWLLFATIRRAGRAFLILAGTLPALLILAQEKVPTSTWDGIYTAAQAAAGETAYRENCASCHGPTLEGKGQTPGLVGSEFTTNWNGMSVGLLLEKIQSSMPADRPGQLSLAQNTLILAQILKANKFPEGKELPADVDALKAIRFDAVKPAK